MAVRMMVMAALLATAPVASAGMDLSQAYSSGSWRAANSASVAVLTVSEPTMADTAQTAVDNDAAFMEQQRARYQSGRRMHRAGNWMVPIGGGVMVVSAFTFLVAAFAGDGGLAALTAFTAVGGFVTFYAGGILSSVGALRATGAVNQALGIDIPRTAGFAGLGVSAGSGLLMPFGVGVAGPIVGVICGAIQMRYANTALENAGLGSLRVSPTLNGLALSARF